MAYGASIRTCSGQWSSLCRFYQTLATFYLLLIAVQLCQAADSLSESNAIRNVPSSDSMHDNPSRIVDIIREQPFKEELFFRPVYTYSKLPYEAILYKLISENQFSSYDPIMERRRKYDQSDRSFIRFGRSDPLIAKQSRPKELRQFINYLNKRPASMDTSFLRFGRSVNQQANNNP